MPRCQGLHDMRAMSLSARTLYLISESLAATPNAIPENLVLDHNLTYHVTGTSRQEIHLVSISKVDNSAKGACFGLLNIKFQQENSHSSVLLIFPRSLHSLGDNTTQIV